ncbi:MAG: efflux RND transporter periplasmic adaptor subunit [Verrucomicrobiales bacterium]|nr:efflux RND transporter periplasmic adaptor subunit [Verrucomicrobiales bacterium]
MKRFGKVIIGVAILFAGIAFSALLWITRPEAAKKEEIINLPVVEYMTVSKGEEIFQLPSQGIIQPDKRTQLSAEVGGKVIEVSPAFEAGMQVSKGDVLIRIDKTDYEATEAQAASNLAEAEVSLASEEAKADQAMRDWRRLGNAGEPSALLARKPQLKSARARVASARAALAKAGNDLERTTIRAPYDGIIASTSTELGNYLAPAAPVGEIYTISPFEVRLPLSVDSAAFLPGNAKGHPEGIAEIRATAAGKTRRWKAEIIRSEGEIDRSTRSLYLVARVGESIDASGIQIRPGLYVDALIPSRPLSNVAKIPFRAFRDLNELVIIKEGDLIDFRRVTVIHREGDFVYVSDGLKEGERISLTELPDLVAGMRVDASPAAMKSRETKNPLSE